MPSFGYHLCKAVMKHFISRQHNPGLSIEKQRAMQRKFGRLARLPRSTQVRTVSAHGVEAQWITPTEREPKGVFLFLHGGAYVYRWNITHRFLAAHIARASGTQALLVNYRLAPEYPYPAAIEDAAAAYRWVIESGVPPGKIVVGGDSAGGGLTMATLISLRDEGVCLPAAALCLSPWADLTMSGESCRSLAEADPCLNVAWLQSMADLYAGGCSPRSPLISPVFGDLRDLPPVLIQVGEEELLLSDSTLLAQRIRESGGEATLDVCQRMWHGWQFFVGFMPEAREAIRKMGAYIREHIGR